MFYVGFLFIEQIILHTFKVNDLITLLMKEL